MQGAVGVWVGARFVAAAESRASRTHKAAIVSADFTDTLRTLVVGGRPLRVRRNEYVQQWEDRPQQIKELTERGVVPMAKDMDEGADVDLPFLMGQVAAMINDAKPARAIVADMATEAVAQLKLGQTHLGAGAKSKL
jgi:NAD(P)H-dependent flavin oxidoreductase YrpB (nitropropane dioxygenase family)